MAKLSPFIRLNDGKCREAMEFYKSCLGGEVSYMTLGESPMVKDFPKEKHDLIMHSVLTSGKMTFSASDMMRDKAVIGDNVGMTLECTSQDEIDDLFSKFSKGGEIFMKPREEFWGGVFGLLTDKYGVEWMFNFQKTAMKREEDRNSYGNNT